MCRWPSGILCPERLELDDMLKLNRKDWILGVSIALAYIAVCLFTLKNYAAIVDSVPCFNAGDLYWKFFLGKISLPQLAQIMGDVRFDPPFLYVVESIPWTLFPVQTPEP
jgi:hypothetical protein